MTQQINKKYPNLIPGLQIFFCSGIIACALMYSLIGHIKGEFHPKKLLQKIKYENMITNKFYHLYPQLLTEADINNSGGLDFDEITDMYQRMGYSVKGKDAFFEPNKVSKQDRKDGNFTHLHDYDLIFDEDVFPKPIIYQIELALESYNPKKFKRSLNLSKSYR